MLVQHPGSLTYILSSTGYYVELKQSYLRRDRYHFYTIKDLGPKISTETHFDGEGRNADRAVGKLTS